MVAGEWLVLVGLEECTIRSSTEIEDRLGLTSRFLSAEAAGCAGTGVFRNLKRAPIGNLRFRSPWYVEFSVI